MWKILNIFDGDYGCEELKDGETPKVTVTLEDENGNRRFFSVKDSVLYEKNLGEGSVLDDLSFFWTRNNARYV